MAILNRKLSDSINPEDISGTSRFLKKAVLFTVGIAIAASAMSGLLQHISTPKPLENTQRTELVAKRIEKLVEHEQLRSAHAHKHPIAEKFSKYELLTKDEFNSLPDDIKISTGSGAPLDVVTKASYLAVYGSKALGLNDKEVNAVLSSADMGYKYDMNFNTAVRQIGDQDGYSSVWMTLGMLANAHGHKDLAVKIQDHKDDPLRIENLVKMEHIRFNEFYGQISYGVSSSVLSGKPETFINAMKEASSKIELGAQARLADREVSTQLSMN